MTILLVDFYNRELVNIRIFPIWAENLIINYISRLLYLIACSKMEAGCSFARNAVNLISTSITRFNQDIKINVITTLLHSAPNGKMAYAYVIEFVLSQALQQNIPDTVFTQ